MHYGVSAAEDFSSAVERRVVYWNAGSRAHGHELESQERRMLLQSQRRPCVHCGRDHRFSLDTSDFAFIEHRDTVLTGSWAGRPAGRIVAGIPVDYRSFRPNGCGSASRRLLVLLLLLLLAGLLLVLCTTTSVR